MKLKRGDIVKLVFPGEIVSDRQYKVCAVSSENRLSDDRADICEINDTKAFEARRGIGMPIKYIKKVD